MIKRTFFFTLLLLILAGGVFFALKKKQPLLTNLTPSPSSAEVLSHNSEKGISINFKNQNIKIDWFEVKDLTKLVLIPNFKEKKTTFEVKENENCELLTNGGFYTPESSPSGLFTSEGKALKRFQKNSTFNAVFSVNDFETPRITRFEPQDRLRIALQTGPLLIENSEILKINMLRDKNARRMIAATTGANAAIFLAVYDKSFEYSGPLLADLPEILGEFQKETGIVLADALNLDGGSASAFFANEISLQEISPVGSFFCASK